MRQAVLAALAALIGAPAAVAQQESAQQEVLRLELELEAASNRQDASPHRRLFTEDWSGVNSRGKQFNKAQALALIESSTFTARVLDSLRVRVYGEAAVATGRLTFSGTIEGMQFTDRRVLFTNTWIRKQGRWLLVASHITSVPYQGG